MQDEIRQFGYALYTFKVNASLVNRKMIKKWLMENDAELDTWESDFFEKHAIVKCYMYSENVLDKLKSQDWAIL